MRPGLVSAAAAALIAAACAAILYGGAAVPIKTPPPVQKIAVAPPQKTAATEHKSAIAIAEDARKSGALERIDARAPLGKIGLALPPKPKTPDQWKGTLLYRPVASAAGLIEAGGYSIAVAGIEAVKPDESCIFEAKPWACGVRARAAFRSLLRGRAVTCVVPPEPERTVLVAPCRVGKQDIAAWLAENGWARASDTGDYAALGAAASKAGKGIFGGPAAVASTAPSTTSSLQAPPSVADSLLLDADPDAQPLDPTGPPAGSAATSVFPPAPVQ